MPKLWSIALLLSIFWTSASAQSGFRIASTPDTEKYKPLLTAIYQELGITPEYVLLPSERGLHSVDIGNLDAEMGRLMGVSKGFSNLVETKEPLLTMQLQAVVKNGFVPESLVVADLKRYRLGAVLGNRFAESLGREAGLTIQLVRTRESIFEMLVAGRLDIALMSSTEPLASGSPFAKLLTTQASPLKSISAIHTMNRRWAALAPKFDEVVREMKRDGRFAKLMPQT